ncbi:NIPSNAP family protein [Rhizobium sp. L245/93]|uniref:NIPSNAP family protein n=1 Tax=Rhizobium sp. L245/93 TaxID=2819998 RepID=UPI001AD97A18|nr:NIPSNAP family protein [Rhizobium sp. L245/93]MBO9169199.1 NIPSNAP family protein [Rhizobium sp. L245/93]
MITCHLRYIIDAYKIAEFEDYARRWIPIVNRMGGTHHGYFLPSEGASNVAVALFSYEAYRNSMAADAECQATLELEEKNRSIISYERSFMRPILG